MKDLVNVRCMAGLVLLGMLWGSGAAARPARGVRANQRSSSHKSRAAAKPYDSALLTPSKLTAQAPAAFDVKFVTTRGSFVIHVTRAWAPLGADRFYNLVKHRFYNHAGIFRVMEKFVVQFGISAYPDVSKAWHSADIKDDPVSHPNAKWTVAFATDGPDTRTTQIFINVANNPKLDARGFAPFGEVTESRVTIRRFYAGYGELASKQQDEIEAQGSEFLAKNYPKLDSIKSAAIMPGSIVMDSADANPPAKAAPVTPPTAQPKPTPAPRTAAPPKPAPAPPKAAASPAPVKAPPAKAPPPANAGSKPTASSAPSNPKETTSHATKSAPSSSSGAVIGSPALNIPLDGSPSYEETRVWFVSKLLQDGGHQDDDLSTVSYSGVSMDGCLLKYHVVWKSGTSDAYEIYDVQIPLTKVVNVVHRAGVVKLTTSTTAVHIVREEKIRKMPPTSRALNTSRTDGTYVDGIFGWVVNLDFRKQGIDAVDVSSRVVTALQHASDVCKENAPKAREPF